MYKAVKGDGTDFICAGLDMNSASKKSTLWSIDVNIEYNLVNSDSSKNFSSKVRIDKMIARIIFKRKGKKQLKTHRFAHKINICILFLQQDITLKHDLASAGVFLVSWDDFINENKVSNICFEMGGGLNDIVAQLGWKLA